MLKPEELGEELLSPTDERSLEAEDTESVPSFFIKNVKRTLPTALSYDFSITLPVLGILITHLGYPTTAPAVVTMISTIGSLQCACVLPCAFTLGALFGELNEKEKVLKEQQENVITLSKEITGLKNKIGRTPKNGVLAGLLFTPVAVLPMIFAEPVLSTLGQNEAVAASAQEFFRCYAPFFLTFSPRLAMAFVLFSSGHTTKAMLIVDSVLLATITLEYTLAFETPLALTGLGLANGFGLSCTAIGFTAYVGYKFDGFHFIKNFFSYKSEDYQQVLGFIRMGGPIILTIVSDVAVSFAMSIFAGLLSEDILELQNIATQFVGLNAVITAAASQTTALMASEQRGKAKAGNLSYASIKRVAIAGIMANLVLQLPLICFSTVFSNEFSKMVGSSPDESKIRQLLLINSAYLLIDAVRYNTLETTRALGDNGWPSFISSTLLWCGVGISYLLSNKTDLKEQGLPLGLLIGSLLGVLVLVNRLPSSIQSARLQDSPNRSSRDDFPKTSASWCCFFNKKISVDEDDPSLEYTSTDLNTQFPF
mgnify:CR=1 FL=1